MLLSEHIAQAQKLLNEQGDGVILDREGYSLYGIRSCSTDSKVAKEWGFKEDELYYQILSNA